MGPIEIFWTLLAVGLFLLGAEIFVPGGILGIIGGVGLLLAAAVGFIAFPGFGALVGIGIIVLGAVAIVLWIRIFPRTPMGRRMTVTANLQTFKAGDDSLPDLLGQTGTTETALHPGGFARIGSRHIDVITRGEMVDAGASVEVIEVQGSRVVVRAVPEKKPDEGGNT